MNTQSSSTSNRVLYWIIGILIMGILIVGLYLGFSILTQPPQVNDAEAAIAIVDMDDNFDGSTPIEPPRQMPDFTLTNQNGEPTSLSDLRGKTVLMSFGYTHCPDICPLTLNEFKIIESELGPLGDDVQFVLISVDGERDTPEALARYFGVRGIDHFIGLTGEEDEMRRMGVDYGLFFETEENPNDAENYIVNHTAGSFLLDAEGRWIMRYAFGTETSVIVEDLQALLQGA